MVKCVSSNTTNWHFKAPFINTVFWPGSISLNLTVQNMGVTYANRFS